MTQVPEEIKTLLSEMFNQSDRAAAVVAASVLDELLRKALLSFLLESSKADELLFGVYKPLSSLKAKTDVALLLGLISPDECADLNTIRQIRNDFAHKFDILTFSTTGISLLCGKLNGFRKTNPPAGLTPTSADVFKFSVTVLAYRLHHLSVTLPRVSGYKSLSDAITQPNSG